jgi:hypothetical protein
MRDALLPLFLKPPWRFALVQGPRSLDLLLEPGSSVSIVTGYALSKGCHLDVVRGPSTPHDPESDAGWSLSSWQRHPSR